MIHVALVERTAWLLAMITSLLDAPIAEARYRGVSTKGAIPMDIVFSSTTQLAAAIRAGHVSAIEVLQAHLAQIDAHNPTLNAIITLDVERAYERAREPEHIHRFIHRLS